MIYLGLDLGQAGDFTAVMAVEKVTVNLPEPDEYGYAQFENQYHVRHAQRFALGVSYVKIVEQIGQMVQTPQLKDGYYLIADATGCGRPVIDMLRAKRINNIPVMIVAGLKETFDMESGFWHVPKRAMVSNIQLLLGNDLLKFADNIPEKGQIKHELQNFKMKLTKSGNDTYEAWREGDHDDLVLALAIACWYAHKYSGKQTQAKRELHPLAAMKGIV